MKKKKDGVTSANEDEAQPKSIPENIEHLPATDMEAEKESRAPIGQTLKRIASFLIRLILFIVILGGIGAGVYFGWPLLYERYIRPVEQNTTGLNDLEQRQAQSEADIKEMQTRLAELESGQAAIATSQTDMDNRLQTLESADVKRSESLVELTYQSDLLRAMELLSRARLYLYQSNFGQARLDVQTARDVLADLRAISPDAKLQDLDEAIFRLDLALKNLPDFPVAATDDIDIAWQVLMGGYPVPAATQTPTIEAPTQEITVTPTVTP